MAEILPELTELTDRATVLAWNAPFDARMLEQTSAAWGLTHPKILFACAMQMYARLKRTKRTGLHKAVGQEGLAHLLELHQSHRALGDVTFVLEVLRALHAQTLKRSIYPNFALICGCGGRSRAHIGLFALGSSPLRGNLIEKFRL